ncbi:AlpA family transcriptional regulator [Thalassococcus sp. S3]|uniref:helix-turn-helix transcriptional regulator n=1 Tax=Thalassococcus sp. S3 TaxID=2017482 RepID=UPI0010247916|nr:hypothetical protein [Thalassococcus sp. S3]QBF32166.1 hypothetical protein CFI11_13190 [Thalassococcus sp. S3]
MSESETKLEDRTFDNVSAFGSRLWVASRLGVSLDTFYRKRESLEEKGFPKPDPLLNLYNKADVDAWNETRRQIKNANGSSSTGSEAGPRLNAV